MKFKGQELFEGETSAADLRVHILSRMVVGAGAAAVLVGAVVGTIVVIWFVGTLLPEQSRMAVDPTPDSFGVPEAAEE
ncbi:MAG: RC-LH1 core complex protein PufX [Pseudomonadota bacterium]